MSFLDDASITAEMKPDIIRDPFLKVVTAGGVVQLSGTGNSQISIDRAQEIATGFKKVHQLRAADTANLVWTAFLVGSGNTLQH